MIGLNEIYNVDCFDGITQIDDGSVSLMVTDPPYLFDNGRWHTSKAMGERSILGKGSIYDTESEIYTDMSKFGVDDIIRFLDLVLPKFKIPNMYICCSDTQVPIYGMWARDNGLHFQILTWEKPLSIINKNRFSTNAEFVCRIYDFGTALNKVQNNEYYNKVIHTSTVLGKDKIHPTEKPLEMFARFVMLSSNDGELVIDPFSGSGTTAMACETLGRNYVCFEKNEKFYKASVQRINAAKSQLKIF